MLFHHLSTVAEGTPAARASCGEGVRGAFAIDGSRGGQRSQALAVEELDHGGEPPRSCGVRRVWRMDRSEEAWLPVRVPRACTPRTPFRRITPPGALQGLEEGLSVPPVLSRPMIPNYS